MNVDHLREDIQEIKEALKRIDHTLHGNGTPGVKTRLAVLESWASSASRLVWLVVGSALSAITSMVIVIFKVFLTGGGQ